jgi:LmbE family N-acetylglucosaminyl deacetylase
MNPYLDFVQGIETGFWQAKDLSASGKAPLTESNSKVLLFSPHPDDECITGLLPLRLMRETGRQIINIPVTFGSNVQRQAARATELENACGYLGWHIYRNKDNLQSLDVEDVAHILTTLQPEIIFVPHPGDRNKRHISTHFLIVDALAKMNPVFSCHVVETEFWGAMMEPNLMVEGDVQSVADLVAATSLHSGEVNRNPYHLMLPAWMQDNVRRGSELVSAQGDAAPDFGFATLYRLHKWQNGGLKEGLTGGKILSMNTDLNEIF